MKPLYLLIIFSELIMLEATWLLWLSNIVLPRDGTLVIILHASLICFIMSKIHFIDLLKYYGGL